MTSSASSAPSPGEARRERWLARLTPIAFAGSRPDDSDEDRLRKALLMGGSLLILPVALTWGVVYAVFSEWPSAVVTLGYAAADAGSIVYLARTGRKGPLAFVHWFCTLLLPFVLTVLLGGIYQSSFLLLGGLMAPLGALLYHRTSHALRLFIAYGVLVAIIGAVDPFIQRDNNLPQWLILTFLVLNVIIVSALAFFQMRAFVRQRDEALRLLTIEQEKTDSLLVNVLPRSIADILKDGERTIAECFDDVTILFADVVGYTPLTATLDAAELVDMLNDIYTHFDTIIERHGIEKIRTMGDGYMAAAGVPSPRADHAQAMAGAALDMLAFVDRWDSPHAPTVKLRIGINTGTVMAGVIGRKKFSYDVWGDPVNVASRMESQGVAGRIQVTGETCALLRDEFVLEPRGSIEVKGKGQMETWFLVGRRADAAAG